MKKESVSWGMVKQMICGVKAMVKRKTRALKARLIIHSLLSHTNFLVSSFSHNLHHHQHRHRHRHQHCELQVAPLEEDQHQHQYCELQVAPLEEDQHQHQHQHCELQAIPLEEDRDRHRHCELQAAPLEGDRDRQHQHRHCELRAAVEEDRDEEEGRSGGSVIEMVKHSKEKAGEKFSLEQDIDHVADLFIRNFHHQMRMQKQHSLKRYQDMLLIDGTL